MDYYHLLLKYIHRIFKDCLFSSLSGSSLLPLPPHQQKVMGSSPGGNIKICSDVFHCFVLKNLIAKCLWYKVEQKLYNITWNITLFLSVTILIFFYLLVISPMGSYNTLPLSSKFWYYFLFIQNSRLSSLSTLCSVPIHRLFVWSSGCNQTLIAFMFWSSSLYSLDFSNVSFKSSVVINKVPLKKDSVRFSHTSIIYWSKKF